MIVSPGSTGRSSPPRPREHSSLQKQRTLPRSRPDGSDLQPVVQEEGPQRDARFSPDGSWVVYTAINEAGSELWAAPFPAMDPRRPLMPGADPEFTEDGELFFTVDGLLMVAEVSYDPILQLGPGVPLFEIDQAEWAVSPDGSTIYTLAPNPDAPAREIRVIFNWFEELRQRVPN